SHLPTITGEVIVIDANAGRRLGVLHGGTVTVRRTAALSLLAIRTLRGHTALASGDSHGSRASTSAAMSEGTLLVLGAGAQARGHAEALAGQPGVTGVVIA